MRRLKVLFFGTPEFALVSLNALVAQDGLFEVVGVVTQPDRPAGRGQKVRESPVKIRAVQLGIPVLQPVSIKRELSEFISKVDNFGEIDIGVVVAFGQILPEEVLSLPKFRCINVHGSLLPRWRGAAPIQRAIMSGDRETGVCIMQMDRTLDTGAVYSSISTQISDSDDLQTLHDRLALLGAQELTRSIPLICDRKLTAVAQQEIGVTYAERITAADRQINWLKSATEIVRQVRALSPSPGAYTTLNGSRLKIFRARTSPQSSSNKGPGDVIFVDRSHLEIATGDGALVPEEIQVEGRSRMTIAEFLRGNQLHLDMKFT